MPSNSSPATNQQPDLEVLPPHPTYSSLLEALELALHKLPGADQGMLIRAQARLHTQYAEGFKRGQELGIRDGYRKGYDEGYEEGRREALDERAREQAEAATFRASAKARRAST